jgi:hypothetical protein
MGEKSYHQELKAVKDKLERSKRGKSSKVKGSSYENTVAKKFKSYYGYELTRTPQSGGFAKSKERASDFKGDIVCLSEGVNFKLHVECKNHKKWSLKEWLKQAQEDCSKDKIPVVIFHQRKEVSEGHVSQINEDYITMKLEDLFKIAPKEIIFKEGK